MRITRNELVRMKGAVLIELAITLPLFIGLFLLTVELSHGIAEYKVLLNQVRTATRYLETQASGDIYGQQYAATCLVVTATPDCSASPVLPGLTSTKVSIKDASNSLATHALQPTTSGTSGAAGSSVNLVTVAVSGYQHSLAFGTVDITFSPISATSRQVN